MSRTHSKLLAHQHIAKLGASASPTFSKANDNVISE